MTETAASADAPKTVQNILRDMGCFLQIPKKKFDM